MNSLIIFCGVLAAASALPTNEVSLVQDNIGNYKLNYETVDSAREEQGFEDGSVRGSYSYTDNNGTAHAIKYLADPTTGFIVEGNLPTQVAETPEVAAARAYHLAIVEQTRALLPELPEEEEELEVVQTIRQPAPRVATTLVKTSVHAPAAARNEEEPIKLIAPSNVKLSPADVKALTAAIKKARASNTPLEDITVVPSTHRGSAPRSQKKVNKNVVVDNTAEIEEAKAQLFAAHRAAVENLAREYRRIAKKM